MKRYLKALGLGVAMVAMTAVPGLSQTVLDFPSWQTEDKSFAPWWQAVIAEFEKQHPDVKVQMSMVPFADYVKSMTVRFASNNPPDIVHLPARNFAAFASNDWLAPLDEKLATTDIPANWSPLQKNMQWNGTTQGVLLMGYGNVLFYNQDLIDKAGVAVPTTPDELVAAAEKITDKDAGVFGFGGVTTEHPNVGTEIAAWVMSQGLDVFKDGAYNFTDPAVVTAIDKYRSAIKQSPPGAATAQLNQLFADGKIAFVLGGPWHWVAAKQADGKWVPHARMGNVPFEIVAGGVSNGLHVAAATPPEKQELAWEFIKLATQPEFMEKYTASTYSPAARVGALSEAAIAADPVLKVVADAAAVAVDTYPTVPAVQANYNEYANLLTQAGIRLQTTDDATATVLAELQAELERRVPLK
jgi:multiple sugar transport system substrate-binding protein